MTTFSILALLAAFSTPAQAEDDNRSLSEAIDVAIEQCSATAFGSDATLDGRIAVFMYAEGQLASVLQRQGLDTTAQLPDLIQRFVATSRYSRLFGSRDVVAIGADDGVVWLVETANPQHCDIAVTGIADAITIPAAVAQGITANEGWNEVSSASNEVTWDASYSFAGAGSTDESWHAHITATGLYGEQSAPDGIQAEINFSAEVATASPPDASSQ